MSNFELTSGFEYSLNMANYKIHSKLVDDWQVEDMATGRITFVKSDTLLNDYMNGELIPKLATNNRVMKQADGQRLEAFLNDKSEIEKHQLKIKLGFVKYFNKNYQGKCSFKYILKALNEYWDTEEMGKPPSKNKAYRWIKSFNESGGDPYSLESKIYNRGSRDKRLPKEIEVICNQVIATVYLTKYRVTVKTAYLELLVAIHYENKSRIPTQMLKPPSIAYFRKLIHGLNKYDVCKARYGQHTADMQFRNVVGHTPSAHINDRWEVDHTTLDVIALDDEYGLVIGRPTLTTITDKESKCYMAATLSFDTNSTIRVADAIKQAILPKSEITKEFPSIKNKWLCYGIPNYIASDRGPDLIGLGTAALLFALNVEHAIMPPFRGDKKGGVERPAGVLNQATTERMPGKTFNSNKNKGYGYNPAKYAKVPLKLIREVLYRTIIDVFHKTPHRTLGISSEEKWIEGLKSTALRLPPSPDFIDVHMGYVAIRTLSHCGIEINNMLYNSEALGKYIRINGHIKSTIRWNPEDLGHVILMKEGGGYLKVPANNSYITYAKGLNLTLHKMVISHLSSKAGANTPLHLALTRHEIVEDLYEGIAANKKLKRVEHAALKNEHSTKLEKNDGLSGHSKKLGRLVDSYPELSDEQVPNLRSI